ncbi:MAG TPA: DUF6178 family protein [Polyangia bacterium]
MTSLSRPQVPAATQLLMRILERPGLVAAVRELPGAVLGKLIDRIGLEDAGELVALASTAQLERIFDDDLWRADRAGGDETFRPERFALWLRVMLEAGDEALVRRLCELPPDLVALGVHRLVLVVDIDVVEEALSPGDEEAEALASALENCAFEEWEDLRVIAREPDAWDDVWYALLALDRDHHDRLRAILDQCVELNAEYISGQGGFFQVLTATEMLDSDVAAARDDRRAAEGFVSPADARAFLELARRGGGDARDPITRAYFRELAKPAAPAKVADPPPKREADGARELVALLRQAEVIAPEVVRAQGALPAMPDAKPEQAHVVAPLFEQAMKDLRERDPDVFSARVREVSYLVNVWIAGGAHAGRRPRPTEAMEVVLKTCEAGLRAHVGTARVNAHQALALLLTTPADVLFRRGYRSAA